GRPAYLGTQRQRSFPEARQAVVLGATTGGGAPAPTPTPRASGHTVGLGAPSVRQWVSIGTAHTVGIPSVLKRPSVRDKPQLIKTDLSFDRLCLACVCLALFTFSALDCPSCYRLTL